jgi:hypothetical protein
MANKWLVHIKKTMRRMKAKKTYVKGKGLKQVIDEAKKSWHKVKKGGAESESDSDELKEVPLKDAPAATSAAAAASSPGTSGMEMVDGTAVLGGRKRKTQRRGRHSRRR